MLKRSRFMMGFYAVILKETRCGDMRYGNNYYDYADGTMVFFAPGQVITHEPEGEWHQPYGKALVFHADMIKGTTLGKQINEYSFFNYKSNEALHLSEKEKATVSICLDNIESEIRQNIDKHSKKLIVANLELLLKYCSRFYDRQFITRENVNHGIVEQFEEILNDFFRNEKHKTDGLPSVSYFADQLHLSSNYFGDLIKKETGKSALDFIHLKLLETAKDRILDTTKSISEIAYELGFKYPQHFSRLFKQKVGVSPLEYRGTN
ncbi:helix-turn-helix domain-containing protein [Emticicia sp. CRIBPO]|nr:helix-turn-helix domain-containing protein [Emticicia sp. CRIBPO]